MLTVYSTTSCGFCQRLKLQLDRDGIAYREVDVESDPVSAQYVMSVNGGNAVVPTVLLPNGAALTNPTIVQIRQRLAAIGEDR